MNNDDLCDWLLANCSGVYRPAAIAAARITTLESKLRDLISAHNNNTGWEPSVSVLERSVDEASVYLRAVSDQEDVINLVELVAEDEEQETSPCKWGNIIINHACYCHNSNGPRKCQQWRNSEPYEECKMFEASNT